MLINIQFEEAEKLLRELLRELPEDKQEQYAQRVDRIASKLHHPNLDGFVVFTFGGDGALETT